MRVDLFAADGRTGGAGRGAQALGRRGGAQPPGRLAGRGRLPRPHRLGPGQLRHPAPLRPGLAQHAAGQGRAVARRHLPPPLRLRRGRRHGGRRNGSSVTVPAPRTPPHMARRASARPHFQGLKPGQFIRNGRVAGDWGPGTKPRRYVVCFNPAEARRDAAGRETILASLRSTLKAGAKELVGNAGYRRFLASPREGHFEIDAARIADDARFDGLHVLRTNSSLNMLSVALAYRELWRVEAIFRTAKSILETRPIFHQSDAAIAGHLFCSFLALLLREEL